MAVTLKVAVSPIGMVWLTGCAVIVMGWPGVMDPEPGPPPQPENTRAVQTRNGAKGMR
jgi:hypothetical protein